MYMKIFPSKWWSDPPPFLVGAFSLYASS